MKTKQTAAQAYQMHQNDVDALLDLIWEEMAAHAEHAKRDGLHWGHVGDVGNVRARLIEVLAQIAQQDEAFVEKHLADLRSART